MERRLFLNTLGMLSGTALIRSNTASSSLSRFRSLLAQASTEEAMWTLVRQQFLLPEDYVYLNTGGLGAAPLVVIETVREHMRTQSITPRPGHDLNAWNDIKERCARLLGPGCDKEDLALTNTATEGINIVVNGLPLKRGDEVITSTHEHPALNITLLSRMQRDGIVLKTFEPDLVSGLGNLDRIEQLHTQRTRLVFISHITCTTGQRFPEREICRWAKSKGLWIGLDGAQVPGGMPVDVKDYGVDFYALSGHKWMLGPKRTGILYVSKPVLDVCRPMTVGAYSDAHHDIRKQQLDFVPTAQRFEYATQNEALFFGLGKAADFIDTLGVDSIWERNRNLAERFVREIRSLPGVNVLSPEEEAYRTFMVTFKHDSVGYRDIASALMKKRIRVRVVPEAGLEAVRASFHLYNSEKDVERIITELRSILG